MNGIDFVERINTLLRQKKISKAEFYKDLNLPNNATTGWGKRNQIPSAETVYKIANYFDVSMEYLMEGQFLKSENNNELPKEILNLAYDILSLPPIIQKIIFSIVNTVKESEQ